MKNILIIGASSAIAKATARLWAKEGHRLYLVARDQQRLEADAADLQIRGAQIAGTASLDVNDLERHETVIGAAVAALGGLDIALIAHGTLGDQKAGERDFQVALRELSTNALSVLSLLTHLANRLEAQKHGAVAVISSVAGDRGRQSNYIYGTAKGAVSIFMQGLRQRLAKSGVQVLTVKPGFVEHAHDQGLQEGGALGLGRGHRQGHRRGAGRRKDVVYAPGFWRAIMLIIRAIPERVFKKLSL